jgi:hypothetical protein
MARKAESDDPVVGLQKTMRALLLASLRSMKQREQIEILDRSGFGRSEIADIVGSTPNAVGVRLAEIKKSSKSK